MESRSEKYYSETLNPQTVSYSTRSGRNARLYKQVSGKYEDLDNLPIDDNTDEIDMDKLKELVLHNQSPKEEKEFKNNLNVLEQRKRKIDEQRVYDINKILEKAKYENNKLKDHVPSSNTSKMGRSILSTLESNELSLEDIKMAHEEEKKRQQKEKQLEEHLSMTRELKYQNLNLTEKSTSNEDLSLDLFEDLKPTGNTIVTKPIKDSEVVETKAVREDFRSSDTRDIDIIKPEQKSSENDFFTSSYEFSKNDFTIDDDFEDLKKKGGLWKILLLILAITVFVGVIVYFVGTYGLGIS